ncbi:site-specific DNA-methyltransferase [uncultured Erythrobacter sp.]|uniref:site-specific DNA-methyltransferase n=1 Tax=uncultured Erythrobacter sp. TaxID=263913 RepID=UPI002615F592|nr:site-specific DNA-methyltransferase [uncultured Erythrobacter sp.]
MTDQPENMPDKMDLASMDIAEEKREALKQLFPEVFAEGKIDFDQLKRVLGEWVEPGKERFGLTWPGKAECMRIIQSPSVATLKPVREESVNFDETENVFIEGDNLEVLKLLQKAYFGRVKMIYIDPPYNTGGEFIYPDKYAETLDTYLAYTGQIDDEGRKFSTNTDSGGRYHSNWLNMIYPRLYLSRGLLREDGVAFISIGDLEYGHLKSVCDQIFGEENFISTISRVMKSGGAKGRFFTPNVDFILVYAQNIEATEYFRTKIGEYQKEKYYKYVEAGGPKSGQRYGEERLYKASLDPRPNQRYWIQCPDGSFVIPPGPSLPGNVSEGCKVTPTSEDGVWKWIYDSYKREKETGNIIFKETSKSALIDQNGNLSRWNIYNKLWLEEQEKKGKVPSNYLDKFENRQSSAELKELEIPFDYAKPTGLIKHLVGLSRAKANDLILDFFAGAGSTADAVQQYNAENQTSLRFISVQLPEKTDPDSAEHKGGYRTISELAVRRIIKAGEKLQPHQTSLAVASPVDVGLRLFRLARSTFRLWDGQSADLEQQIDLHVQNIDPSATPEDIVYELLLKSGFPLTTKVEAKEIAGKTVYSVEDGALLICLDKEITSELIDALADADPLQVICLDEGFKGNDQLKTNAVQTFKARAASRETEIVFRTV